jgi:hypothetical protein
MDQKRTREELEEVYRNSGLGKWFHDESAGDGPGWDRYNTKGERVGKCGDSKPGEGKPKCLSRQKADKLRSQGGKKAIANAVRRKREKDPVQDRPGTGNKPKNVSNNIKEATMEKINIKGIFPEMMISVNGEVVLVESVNRLGDTTYCVNYIKENKQRSKELYLKNDFVEILEDVEYETLNEEKETKKVLNKIHRGGSKKFYVYVKNDKGNVVKVSFGDKNMEIKRDDPNRRKNFRARHNCGNPGPKWKARYWACKTWEKGKSVSSLTESECKECLQEENVPQDPSLWSKAKSLAKKKFDVYPSAYANAWASKWYKKHGGSWKKKVNEETVKDVEGKQFFLTKEGKTIVDDIEKQLKNNNVFAGRDDKFRKNLSKLIALGNEIHMREKEQETPEVEEYNDENIQGTETKDI